MDDRCKTVGPHSVGCFVNRKSVFVSFTGSQHLEEQGIDHDTEWDFWKNILAVGMIVVGLLCISYIQLRRIKKLK